MAENYEKMENANKMGKPYQNGKRLKMAENDQKWEKSNNKGKNL